MHAPFVHIGGKVQAERKKSARIKDKVLAGVQDLHPRMSLNAQMHTPFVQGVKSGYILEKGIGGGVVTL